MAAEPLARARELLGGKRVVVLGLGREGLDLATFLAAAGAEVTVADEQPAERLQDEVARLAGRPVTTYLGELPVDRVLAGADCVFVSPGVPPEHPLVTAARAGQILVSSLVELFFELCPAPILGVTGSAGKTTTTSLLGEMFRAAGRDVHVGGNIGKPLLGELQRIAPTSDVVLELSSFQLEHLRRSPRVALVTNVTPNHLDRHGTMEAYWEAKRQIIAHQGPGDWAVLNADDAWSLRFKPRGRSLRFSLEGTVEGAYLAGSQLMLLGEPLVRVDDVPLRGRHNLANVLAAAAAAHAAGIEREPMVAAIRAFRGVPHRLEVVGERGGARYVNDSIATAPERSMAGLRAFHEPLVLIAGGGDKGFPEAALREWLALAAGRVKHLVLLDSPDPPGRAGVHPLAPRIAAALRALDGPIPPLGEASSMDDAVRQAASVAAPGEVVLLSPGGTSYDRYRDFEERGRDFARAVSELP